MGFPTRVRSEDQPVVQAEADRPTQPLRSVDQAKVETPATEHISRVFLGQHGDRAGSLRALGLLLESAGK